MNRSGSTAMSDRSAAWMRRAVLVAASTAAAFAFMVLTDMSPDPTLIIVTGVVGGVALITATDLLRSAAAAGPAPQPTRSGTAPRVDARIRSLRFNIRSMRDERAERLYRLLVELIDDQLVVPHGIDRAAQPDRAAAVLGPELQRFVTDPSSAASLKRLPRLDRVVTQIEQL